LFGRHERLISELYRSLFVDLGDLVATIREHSGSPATILEIGCGDGMVTERIAHTFPDAAVTGIDICTQPGRLYRGDRSRVRFLRLTAQDLITADDARYQLVIIADVLHHVPHPDWAEFVSAAGHLTADGGTLVVKDWVRQPTLAYLFGYLSDRYITGDRIRYPDEGELRALTRETFGTHGIQTEFRVKPWDCNLALVIAPSPPLESSATDAQSSHAELTTH
jgi:2-polyprenyl-6-hydroxyphenyl methylase/3-demethylubiquinone-9 3-methyltransferase